jgi:hypothetical protein
MRLAKFVRLLFQSRDPWGGMLWGLLTAVAVWLALMPFSRPIQQVTLRRFHLNASSFFSWSCLQIIPPMYNLENRFWYSSVMDHDETGSNLPIETGVLNHFPARVVTCFDHRDKFFSSGDDGELLVESRYQDQRLFTTWRLVQERENRILMIRE